MQFIVLGYDGTDEEAPSRRAAARENHLAQSAEAAANGEQIFAAALLNDSDNMCGSAMVVDFPSRQELENWLKSEPYVTGHVWKDIQIYPCKIAPSFEKLIPGRE